MSKSVISLVDHGTQKGKSTLDGATVANHATFLQTYSDAGMYYGSLITYTPLDTTQDPAADSNLDDKLVITYKYKATGEIGRIAIPAYKTGGDPAVLSFVQSEIGERLSQTSGEAVVSSLETALGLAAGDLIFLSGVPFKRK